MRSKASLSGQRELHDRSSVQGVRGAMSSKVFISYRRDDAKWQAREIYRSLTQVLPRDHVFMDIDAFEVDPIGCVEPSTFEQSRDIRH